MNRFYAVLGIVWFTLISTTGHAQSPEFDGVVAGDKWTVLRLQNRRSRGSRPLAANAKVKNLSELVFSGPRPGHPFVLGNYSADGEWGMVNGYLQKMKGEDAAFQVAWADQFELEGVAEHAQLGGWFLLLGWDQGHGYSVSNVKLKTSGSPWFVAEMRGAKSLEETVVEFDHFDWKGEQPFRVSVKNNTLTVTIGRAEVLETPLDNYKPGAVVWGVYDTEYGPKPIRIKSLRIRSLPKENTAPDEGS